MFWDRKTECAPRDKLTALQSRRLRETVSRVYERVPFYRRRMESAGVFPDDIKGIEDLSKLPFTYKKDLIDAYPYGAFAVPMRDIVRVHASSGTSGKQTVTGYTKRDIETWAELCARSLAAAGADSGSIVQISVAYGLFTGGLGMSYGAERIGAAVIPVSTGNTARQVKIIRDFKPTVIHCTPSYGLYLSEALEKAGLDAGSISLKTGIFGAEPWTDEMRIELEKRLGIKAFDIYGLTEITGPGVAFECEEQSGMHVNEDNFIAEVIDPDTEKILPAGSRGELVFSCINKDGAPLLRYRTRDIGFLSQKQCSCGRTFVKMSKPLGRSDDMLIIRGVNVFPSQVESVLLSTENTRPQYRIVVDRINNADFFEILVEVSDGTLSDAAASERVKLSVKRAMESVLGVSPRITLVRSGTLPRSEDGKISRVLDKRRIIIQETPRL